MGHVHGYGTSRGDDDLSSPLGTFGNTGGHRQDLDSAGAYVVAGPEGEDLSHAIGAANANRHDPTFQTYVGVPAAEEAATLTKGSSSEGVSYPGRRKEDDENLVVQEEPSTFDWQAGGGPVNERSRTWIHDKPGTARALTANKTLAVHVPPPDQEAFVVEPEDGQGADLRARPTDVSPAISDKGRHDRGAFVASGVRQTAQGTVLESDEQSPPLMGRGGSVGNNSPMVYEDVSSTLKGQRGKGGGGIGPEETLIPEGPQAFGIGSHAGTAGGEATNSSHASGGPTGMGITEEETPALVSGRTQAVAYRKAHGAASASDGENWEESDATRSLNGMGYATDVVAEGIDTQNQTATGDVAGTLRTPRSGSNGLDDATPALRAGAAVRRLSPVECERLQGFPDGWTAIDGDATPDGPRYAALGDAVTVNTAQWVVARIVRKLALEAG